MIIATGAVGQRDHHAQIPRHRAEHRPLARLQIHHDLGPFGGGEQEPSRLPSGRQEAGVRCDDCELAVVGERHMVDPRG
jgi:hypothetical protein